MAGVTTTRLATTPSNRRGFLLAAGAASVLAACGSGTIESALKPTRIIAFGDGLSDLGKNGSRYTVNDGSVNVWTAQIASNYGIVLTSVTAGGWSYAEGNARVTGRPDAAGSTLAVSIKQQIDAFLASSSFGTSDLVLINGGLSDIVYEMAAVTAGTQTTDQMVANVAKAAQDLAAQLQRLVLAGAKYVVVAGVYNLAKSPWAISIAKEALLGTASSKFNEQLLVNIVGLGTNVLYSDAAYYYNLVTAAPTGYALLDSTSVMCTSIDPTNGIGIGVNKVNSSLCNTGTIATGLDYTKYAFADPLYFTPAAQALFGNFAYTRLKARW